MRRAIQIGRKKCLTCHEISATFAAVGDHVVHDRSFKLKFTLWLVVAAVLIYYFIQRLDWAIVKQSFRQLNLALALTATLPILGTYFVRALRWRAFLEPIARPSIRNLFSATVIGFSSILIFGRIGEVARPVMLSLREHIRPSATVATIMVERLFDSTAVVLVFGLDIILFQHAISSRHLLIVREAGLGLFILSTLGVVGLSIFRARVESVLGFMKSNLSWLPAKGRRVLLNLLRHLADGLYVLHDFKSLAITVGYTVLIWALVTSSFWLVARAFATPLPVPSVLFILGFALVGSLVPTPGGSAGAFHTSTMIGLTLLGIEQNKAASMAIAMHLVAFGSALIFGVYFFMRDGLSFKALRALISQEMVSLHGTANSPEERVGTDRMGAEL